jgi:hypothetical protein
LGEAELQSSEEQKQARIGWGAALGLGLVTIALPALVGTALLARSAAKAWVLFLCLPQAIFAVPLFAGLERLTAGAPIGGYDQEAFLALVVLLWAAEVTALATLLRRRPRWRARLLTSSVAWMSLEVAVAGGMYAGYGFGR